MDIVLCVLYLPITNALLHHALIQTPGALDLMVTHLVDDFGEVQKKIVICEEHMHNFKLLSDNYIAHLSVSITHVGDDAHITYCRHFCINGIFLVFH